jgi:uncharacterized repeat protein (TIGR03803 family)
MKKESTMQFVKSVTAVLLLIAGCGVTSSVQAQNFTPLFSFNGVNGAFPVAGLIRDPAGNLYGTTEFANAGGTGNVFKLDSTGKETVLFSFSGGSDGGHPAGGLIRDSGGNLYGTARDGGDLNCFFPGTSGGCGVVFKLDPTGHETVLHVFTGGAQGASPDAAVIRDSAGNLYGTAEFGGNLTCSAGSGQGCGIVFKLDPKSKFTVIHSFTGGDGVGPTATLVRDSAGNLYGTTGGGGAHSGGTVFRLDTSGKLSVLHSFSFSANDGVFPFAGVIRDAAGNLYGTTTSGGASGFGTVYKLSPTGKQTVLHSFVNRQGEGQNPFGALLRDSFGNLFGTTASGGDLTSCTFEAVPGCGTVFKLDPTGKETVLHLFENGNDGANPTAALIRDSNGNLYGTATNDGQNGFGVVFKLVP